MQAKLDHLERLVSQQQRELASLRNSTELRAAIRPPSGRRPSSAGAARQLALAYGRSHSTPAAATSPRAPPPEPPSPRRCSSRNTSARRQSAAAAPSAAPSAAPRAVMVARRSAPADVPSPASSDAPPATANTAAPAYVGAMVRMSRELAVQPTRETACLCISSCMREAAGAEHARLLIVERGQLCLHDVTDARGVLPSYIDLADAGLTGQVVAARRARTVGHPAASDGYAARADRPPWLDGTEDVRSLLLVPLVHGGDVLGVVQLVDKYGGACPNGFTAADEHAAALLVPIAAMALAGHAQRSALERLQTLGHASEMLLSEEPTGAVVEALVRKFAALMNVSPSMLRPRRHSSSSESSSSPPPSTESSPRSLSGSPQAVQRAAAHGFRRSPAGEKRRARSRLGPGLADELNTALTEAANGSPLLMSPDRTGGKHPVAAAALEAGKTADAWLERRPSSDAERSSTPTSRRRGA